VSLSLPRICLPARLEGTWAGMFDAGALWLIFWCSEEFLTGAQGLFLFNSISPQTDKGLY